MLDARCLIQLPPAHQVGMGGVEAVACLLLAIHYLATDSSLPTAHYALPAACQVGTEGAVAATVTTS